MKKKWLQFLYAHSVRAQTAVIMQFLYPSTTFNLQAASVQAKYIFGLMRKWMLISLCSDHLTEVEGKMWFC